jgi:hypothetical protein
LGQICRKTSEKAGIFGLKKQANYGFAHAQPRYVDIQPQAISPGGVKRRNREIEEANP